MAATPCCGALHIQAQMTRQEVYPVEQEANLCSHVDLNCSTLAQMLAEQRAFAEINLKVTETLRPT